ncbi:serine/arginine-rich splicing factor SC35-like [Mangifera indica]|uniref:serine/arginine-rich splicing factor SC35-like n=1 Tax=Mangifera indica TaxID=29780 RepID=UPI001CFC30B8|nr:serine/arginine-rich splicing factor SC35-like [Mangifera indica]
MNIGTEIKDYRKRSRNRSKDRYDRDRYSERERDHCHRSMSCSSSPDNRSAFPTRHSPDSKGPFQHKTQRGESPVGHNPKEYSPALKSVSPHGRRSVSPSPSLQRTNAHEA